MIIGTPIVYTVAALLFFGLGYTVGNSMGDAATFRECVFSGQSLLVNGEEIRCSIVVRPPAPQPDPPPGRPMDSRPKPDRPFPPAGFDKLDQG